MDWIVNVRPTMLDKTDWFSPFIETWTAEKLSWASTPAVHSFSALPPVEAYEGLLKEFQEQVDAPTH